MKLKKVAKFLPDVDIDKREIWVYSDGSANLNVRLTKEEVQKLQETK